MRVYRVLKDFKKHWVNAKKGSFIVLTNSRDWPIKEMPDSFQFLGEYFDYNNKSKGVCDKKTLFKIIQLAELKHSADISKTHYLMKCLNIPKLGFADVMEDKK